MIQQIIQLWKTMRAIKIISFRGLFIFVQAMHLHGINLLALLRTSAKLFPERIAIHDDKKSKASFSTLYTQSTQLTHLLQTHYKINASQKTAIIGRNSLALVQHLFALSGLGVDIYLLNIEMSTEQLKRIVTDKKIALIFSDNERLNELSSQFPLDIRLYEIITQQSNLAHPNHISKIKKPTRQGNLTVLTGGSTGHFKSAARKPSVLDFLPPFIALLSQVQIARYTSVYLGVPICHGYGLASLMISVVLGTKLLVVRQYDTQKAYTYIKEHKIELVILVPLMIRRLLSLHSHSLSTVECIISGGAPLDETLVHDTLSLAGNKLYNLYGTSEAGFSVLATPADLQKYPSSIGRKIKGVSIKIIDNHQEPVKQGTEGTLHIKSKWTIGKNGKEWISTGDRAYINPEGYVFLRGRADSMIVSGGENVYPEDLERVLLTHHQVEDVAVVGVSDTDFGKRLHAFVVPKASEHITEAILFNWLSDKVARYQTPAHIYIIDSLPMLSTGKTNRKALIRIVEEPK